MTDPTTPTGIPFKSQEPIVEYWDDTQWRTFDLAEMWVDALSWRLMNAGVSQATMRYECGRMATDSGPYRDVQPLNLDRTWLRTTIFGDDGTFFSWAGVVVATEEINRASDGGAKRITQRFTVQGMEFWLSRRQITESEFLVSRERQELGMGLTFNSVTNPITGGQVLKGNKDETANPTGYQGQSDIAELWDGEEIINYIKRLHLPTGAWDWESSGEDRLSWVRPVLPTHGRSVLDVLTALASPRRATVCWISYEPGIDETTFGTFRLNFDTTVSERIFLPSQGVIDANANVKNVQTTLLRSAFTSITTDTRARVRKVVAQGARAGAVVTYSIDDNTLEPGWRTQDQDEYAAGDPGAGGIVDKSVRLRRHDRYRRQEYPEIYTRFQVPLNWNGQVTNQNGVIVQAFTADLYIADMKFSSFIPLKVGWEYDSAEPRPTVAAPDVDDFRPPIVAFETNEGWELAEQFGSIFDETAGKNGFQFSITTRPLSNSLGFTIRANPVAHIIASNIVGAIDPNTSDEPPQLDYTKMLITAYTQAHYFAEGAYPNVDAEPEDIHYLRVGETAFFDVMPAGTVVAVRGGNLILSTRDLFLRDDREYLEDVARMAFAWYGKDRVASKLDYQQIYTELQPGQFLETIDDVQANAIISSLNVNVRDQSTSVSTDFQDPDVRQIAPGRPAEARPPEPTPAVIPGRRLGGGLRGGDLVR